jgi:vacuolar-type H+-ATPase subunit E/Vma4
MSLESIVKHILEEAESSGQRAIQEAKKEAQAIIQGAKGEADILYQDIIAQAMAGAESEKQRLIVNARLEYKKNLLQAKHELIDGVMQKLKSELKKDKFKKQQIHADKTQEVAEDTDFYLTKARQDYESEIANILFS